MNEIEFKIFTYKKSKRITPNLIVYSVLLSSLGTAYFSHEILEIKSLENIGLGGLLIASCLMLYFMISGNFKREPLDGTLEKRILFSENAIKVDDWRYELAMIEKVDFTIDDYDGKWRYRAGGNFNQVCSNGTNNRCQLTLKSGQKIEVQFQLMYNGEFLKLKNLLIRYHDEGKLHFLKLIEYLGIDKYEEIQEFKKTLISPPVAGSPNL